jgi:xanthine/uracil permease
VASSEETNQRPQANHAFDVGVDERVGLLTAISIGFQNVLGLAGLLLFPGIIGVQFHLSPGKTAALYGIAFMTSGLVIILQSVWLLRLPIIQGPAAPVFAAILSVGHLDGGLATAFGSLFVAAAIWCVLAIPVRRFSPIMTIARFVRTPIVTGVILLLISTRLATVAVPGWFGTAGTPGFGGVDFLCAAIAAAAVLIGVSIRSTIARRIALLVGIALGSLLFTVLEPTTWHNVLHAHAFSAPHTLPFGFHVDVVATIIFFVVLFPAISETIATYEVVAEWAEEPLDDRRVTQGVFGEILGSLVGSFFGGMATLAYPDNIGFLRVHRVGSRWVTLTTGIILLVLGGFGYFDALLVAIPSAVLSGATAVLFGILFGGALRTLSRVEWTQDNLVIAGVPFLLAIGALFTPSDVQAQLSPTVSLFLGQPLAIGTVLSLAMLLGFRFVRGRGRPVAVPPPDTPGPPGEPVASVAPSPREPVAH